MAGKRARHLKTRREVLLLLKKELPVLRSRFHVKELRIFGSYARGDQRPGSDIDILVEFEEPVGFVKFMNLEFHLRRVLGLKVDLVTSDALKPLIRDHVLSEAVHAG